MRQLRFFRLRRPTRRRAKKAERGAAIVEFALIASLLVTLSLGTIEMGLAWGDSQLVTQAARSGARSAAQLGVDPAADAFIVESVEATLGKLAPMATRIVIFRADNPDGSLPASCLSAGPPGIAGQCSVYDSSDYGNYVLWNDGAWTPGSRDNTVPDLGRVGVRIEIQRPFTTGIFGDRSLQISDTAVVAIEPGAGDS